MGVAPIALTFSSDERYLFTTSQSMPESGWPIECRPEANQQAPPDHTQGAILVIDVSRAKLDPANSVVRTVKAGCNPVRLVTSPKGDVAYLTARGEHALLAFATKKLLDDPSHALIGKVPVGTEVQCSGSVGERPVIEEALRDDVGYRRSFGQRGHACRSHYWSRLSEPLVRREEEGSIFHQRPAKRHAELVTIQSVLLLAKFVGEVQFHIDGVIHVLQFGPQPTGRCFSDGTSIDGDGTSQATITRIDSTTWSVDLPAGSIGRLYDVHLGYPHAIDRGSYYSSMHFVVRK